MRLILVRHGQTVANLNRINEGQRPGILTERGKAQAARVGERLKEEKIDRIYVSDLRRTMDTAAEIIRHHPDVEVTYEPLIREQNQGIHEGTPYGAISAAARAKGLTKLTYRPEGGESLNDLHDRVMKFYRMLAETGFDKTILLVTHGGVIVATLLELFGYPEDDWETISPQNTAVTMLELDFKHGHKVLTLNCVKHLL